MDVTMKCIIEVGYNNIHTHDTHAYKGIEAREKIDNSPARAANSVRYAS